jgi:hypothetical protein
LTIAPGRPARRYARIAVAQPTTAGFRLAPIRPITSAAPASSSHASRNTAALFTHPCNGSASSAARSVIAGSAASPITGTILW